MSLFNNLIKQKAKYDNSYYNDNTSIITDAEYDDLVRSIDKLKNETKLPVQSNVYKLSDRLPKVQHSTKMLSLNNTLSPDVVVKFVERCKDKGYYRFAGCFPNKTTTEATTKKLKTMIDNTYNNGSSNMSLLDTTFQHLQKIDIGKEFINFQENKKRDQSLFKLFLEPKIDGLSLSLVYTDGVLISASTRGNKVYGEDVLPNVKNMDCIPKHLQANPNIVGTFEVRGEVYLTKSNFESLCKEPDSKYSNPRNASSGLLRSKNNTKHLNLLSFAPYGLGKCSNVCIETQEELIKLFKSLGFKTDSYVKLVDDAKEANDYFDHINTIRSNIDYDIDGVVIKINGLSIQEHLGDNGDAPNWALARKFSPKEAPSTLIDVTFNVGKTGVVVPVAHIEPINIGGVFITKASLHNTSELMRLGLCLGDTVIIQRAGDVIPKIKCVDIDNSVKTRTRVEVPELCPSCQTKLVKASTSDMLMCPNNFNCPAQIKARLAKFCSKEGFNIIGLGVKSVCDLYKLGYIKTIYDIFSLEDRKDDLLKLNGFSEKSCNKLLTNIERSKNISMQNFIVALNIPSVSTSLAIRFASVYRNINTWLDAMLNIQNENIDLNKDTIINIKTYFDQPEFVKLVRYLISICTIYNVSISKVNSVN